MERKLTQLELVTTIAFIVSLFISLSLIYNSYLKLDKKNFYSNKLAQSIGVFNRTFVVILTISYLYINIKNEKIAKNKGKKVELFDLQIGASTLSLVSSLIVLYVVIKSNDYNIVSIENPSI